MKKILVICHGVMLCAILIIFAVTLSSCKEQDVKNKVLFMVSKAIEIRTDKMICLSDSDMSIGKESLKWISYYDTIVCKPCQIAHISDWDEILAINGVDCCFILSAKPSEVERYMEAYRNNSNNAKAHVYLDTANVFLHDNPRIPHEALFHDFLIDEKNNVLIVGNPVRSKSIQKMFFNVLNEKGKK